MLAWTLVPGGAHSPAPGVASSEIAGSTCLVCVRVTARYGAAFLNPWMPFTYEAISIHDAEFQHF